MRKINKYLVLTMLVLSTFTLLACDKEESSKDSPIVISSKDYTESVLLGKITTKYLESKGYKVKDETGISGQGIIRQALTSGEVDSYWEFTSTAYMEFMKKELSNDD